MVLHQLYSTALVQSATGQCLVDWGRLWPFKHQIVLKIIPSSVRLLRTESPFLFHQIAPRIVPDSAHGAESVLQQIVCRKQCTCVWEHTHCHFGGMFCTCALVFIVFCTCALVSGSTHTLSFGCNVLAPQASLLLRLLQGKVQSTLSPAHSFWFDLLNLPFKIWLMW